jgi:hypothetical protein
MMFIPGDCRLEPVMHFALVFSGVFGVRIAQNCLPAMAAMQKRPKNPSDSA